MLPCLHFLQEVYQKKRQHIGPKALKRRLLEAKGITIPHEAEAGIICWLAGNYDYSEELVEGDAREGIEPIANVPAKLSQVRESRVEPS